MQKRTNAQWVDDLTADSSSRRTEALEALRVRLKRGLFYYLSRERSDLADFATSELDQMAEDFAQDATLRVLKNLHTFRGDSQFTTWATKVAVRVAISELRRARYRDFSLDDLTAEGEIMPTLSPSALTGHPVGPEKSAERQDMMTHIAYAIENDLTERQRIALQAVAIRGVPLEIVAREMNTNRNALYKLLHDARLKLKNALEREGITVAYLQNLFE